MNEIEMLPSEYGVTVLLIGEDGEIKVEHLSWEEFARLKAALARDPDAT